MSSNVLLIQANKVNNNGKCSFTLLCNDQMGLVCTGGKCTCKANMYFDGKLCQKMKLHGSSCLAANECNANAGLSCIKYKCECLDINKYWTKTGCS